MLLLIEFSVCLMITLWPQCLGLNLDASVMVKVLQAGYGVPGKEQVFEQRPALHPYSLFQKCISYLVNGGHRFSSDQIQMLCY